MFLRREWRRFEMVDLSVLGDRDRAAGVFACGF